MISRSLYKKARQIKLAAFDVDGVLTDGKLYFSAKGDEMKAFNILDGLGIKMLMNNGIDVALITGRQSPLTEKRAIDLGIKHLIQGREDKLVALKELIGQLAIDLRQAAYIGDDLPDLPAIRAAALGITVANGHPFVKQHADWCTNTSGGTGVAREVADLILDAQDRLTGIHESYL